MLKQTLTKAIRWFALITFCMATTGCSDHWRETEQHGVFTATDYWSRSNLRWEGSNTEVYKRKLCSSIQNQCVSGDFIQIADSPGQIIKLPQWLNPAQGPFSHPVLFNKTSGNPVTCLNCENQPAFYQLMAEQHLNWANDGSRAFVTDGKPYLATEPTPGQEPATPNPLWLLEIKADGFTVTNITPARPVNQPATWHNLSFSPDGSNVAWKLCNPNCTLWHYQIAEQTHTAQTTSCPHNSYWNLKWRNNRPYSEHYWSTQEKDLCYNANGKIAFPIQPSPYR